MVKAHRTKRIIQYYSTTNLHSLTYFSKSAMTFCSSSILVFLHPHTLHIVQHHIRSKPESYNSIDMAPHKYTAQDKDFSDEALSLAEVGWCPGDTTSALPQQPSIIDRNGNSHPTLKEAVQADIDDFNETTDRMIAESNEAARQALAKTDEEAQEKIPPVLNSNSDWAPLCPHCGHPNEYDRTSCDPVLPTVCLEEAAYVVEAKDYWHSLSNV